MTESIYSLKKEERVPAKAKLLRKLLELKATGRPIDLWMTFPQNSCCFAFGPSKGPVPIGALFLLWSAGWPYLQECPECQGKVYMVAFCGFLNRGGGHLICPTCENSWYQFLGGAGTLLREYLAKSPLVGTEFHTTGMCVGGAYPSDGKSLCSFLGVAELPESEAGPSFKIAGEKVRLDFGLGSELVKKYQPESK
jgi:hypothetical protein